MIRLFLCCAAQLVFVAVYGTWAALRPEDAFGWMLPFVAAVFALILYNGWAAFRSAWLRLRRWVRR